MVTSKRGGSIALLCPDATQAHCCTVHETAHHSCARLWLGCSAAQPKAYHSAPQLTVTPWQRQTLGKASIWQGHLCAKGKVGDGHIIHKDVELLCPFCQALTDLQWAASNSVMHLSLSHEICKQGRCSWQQQAGLPSKVRSKEVAQTHCGSSSNIVPAVGLARNLLLPAKKSAGVCQSGKLQVEAVHMFLQPQYMRTCLTP